MRLRSSGPQRQMVWLLRLLAAAAVVWGLLRAYGALEAARLATQTVKEGQAAPETQRRLTEAARQAAAQAIFTALLLAALAAAVLLALAETLRLSLALQEILRQRRQVPGGAQEEFQVPER